MKNLTVWKFRDCSITQILREITFWDSISAKSTILTNLVILNFDFYDFLHFMHLMIFSKSTRNRAPKMAKTSVLELRDSS